MLNALLLLSLVPLALLAAGPATRPLAELTLDFDAPTDAALQQSLESLDASLRTRYGMTREDASVGLLDLRTGRLAIINPDRIDYAASVPKIGILLAYFQANPAAATDLDPSVRHELGLMTKASSNTLAAKYSQQLGLEFIQKVLSDDYHFYDASRGGGIWCGKHYGLAKPRYADPVGDHSHAATVRQLLRFYLLLEQGKLVSPGASRTMREIFLSPDVPADDLKFVRGLKGRPVEILRKWGTWEDWRHDTAVVTGPGRHYILVGMTHHPKGDDYLEALAPAIDDLLAGGR